MAPERPTFLDDTEKDILRSIVNSASKIITSDKPSLKKLSPYAAHIIRISLMELRRDDRAVKAAAKQAVSSTAKKR